MHRQMVLHNIGREIRGEGGVYLQDPRIRKCNRHKLLVDSDFRVKHSLLQPDFRSVQTAEQRQPVAKLGFLRSGQAITMAATCGNYEP